MEGAKISISDQSRKETRIVSYFDCARRSRDTWLKWIVNKMHYGNKRFVSFVRFANQKNKRQKVVLSNQIGVHLRHTHALSLSRAHSQSPHLIESPTKQKETIGQTQLCGQTRLIHCAQRRKICVSCGRIHIERSLSKTQWTLDFCDRQAITLSKR